MRGGIKLVVAVVVLGVLFVALNMVAGAGLQGLRLDATRGSLFTLTAGARTIARSPDEPVTLRFYYSAGVAQGRPEIQSYAQRVRELLDEFRRASGGKVALEIIDPEPFSEANRSTSALRAPTRSIPARPSRSLIHARSDSSSTTSPG
jgi:ABC-type uncharacterized transport system involved in gliding motility auxiliary subunit